MVRTRAGPALSRAGGALRADGWDGKPGHDARSARRSGAQYRGLAESLEAKLQPTEPAADGNKSRISAAPSRRARSGNIIEWVPVSGAWRIHSIEQRPGGSAPISCAISQRALATRLPARHSILRPKRSISTPANWKKWP